MYDIDNYLVELKLKLIHAHNMAHNHPLKQKQSRCEKQEKIKQNNFGPGDFIYIKIENKKKFDKSWDHIDNKGPYKIIRQEKCNSYVEIENEIVKMHNNNIIKARNL